MSSIFIPIFIFAIVLMNMIMSSVTVTDRMMNDCFGSVRNTRHSFVLQAQSDKCIQDLCFPCVHFYFYAFPKDHHYANRYR